MKTLRDSRKTTQGPPEDSRLNDSLVATVINAEDEVLIDTRISCTTEEAVIKLLGWMRGPVLKRVIKIAADGEIADSELPHYGFVDDPIDDFLAARRERASVAFHNAVASRKYSFTELVEMEERVDACDAMIRQAVMYRRDIADDLADTATGTLRVDADETARQGTLHITLNSLDRWARKQYGIAIHDTLVAKDSDNGLHNTQRAKASLDEGGAAPDSKSGNDLGPVKSRNLIKTLKLFIEAFPGNAPSDVQVPEFDPDGGLSEAEADQVYLLIARLTVAFSHTATKYQRGSNPNERTIAEHLASKADESGRGFESIRKTLQRARAVAKRAHPKSNA